MDHQVLVGSETAEQLEDTVSIFAETAALSEAEIATVDARLAELAEFIPLPLLNPVSASPLSPPPLSSLSPPPPLLSPPPPLSWLIFCCLGGVAGRVDPA